MNLFPKDAYWHGWGLFRLLRSGSSMSLSCISLSLSFTQTNENLNWKKKWKNRKGEAHKQLSILVDIYGDIAIVRKTVVVHRNTNYLSLFSLSLSHFLFQPLLSSQRQLPVSISITFSQYSFSSTVTKLF